MNKTLLTLALLAAATTASAEPWKYSGNLNDGGAPANGRYDLRLTLLDATKAMYKTPDVRTASSSVLVSNARALDH